MIIRDFLFRWASRIFIFFFASTVFITLLHRWIPVPITPLMLIRLVDQGMKGKSLTLKKNWQPLEDISSNMPVAVVASEDQLFLDHNGFDFKAIEKAMDFNKRKKGKKVKGASTISQQTAKNVFLWSGRSWLRKGLEVYFTFLIETLWSKERIMEVYLNVIEMGPGIYGSQAAAQYYFKKDANQLSKTQCAAIAAILPNPLKWSASKPSAYIQRKTNWILRQMNYLDEKIIFGEEE